MGELLLYILKSAFYLVLFYLFFKAIMSRTTFFLLNRYLILIGTTLCLLLPFVRVTLSGEKPFIAHIQQIEKIFTSVPEKIETPVYLNTATPLYEGKNEISPVNTEPARTLALIECLAIIYFSGVIISLLVFIVSYFRMIRLIHSMPQREYNGYFLVLVGDDICSFSWGKYLVIPERDYRNNPEILLHETIHIRSRHTWDLVYTQFLLVLQWFNPAIWLLKKELQDIHEYQADSETIQTGIDATRYQLLLVEKAVGTRLYSMANGFNHSKLKNRISMMLKEKTSKYASLRVLLLIPVMCAAVYLFAQQQQSDPKVHYTAKVEYDSVSQEADLIMEFEEFAKSSESRNGTMNYLYVNKEDRILWNNAYPELKNLSEAIVKTVHENREKSLKKNGKVDTQIINFVWDRGTSGQRYNEIINAIYGAYRQIKEEIELSGKENNLRYPIVVNLGIEEKNYGSLPNQPNEPVDENTIIRNIELTITVSEQQKKVTLKDFSEKQLREQISQIMSKTDSILVVGIKTTGDTKIGAINDLKRILRDEYSKYSGKGIQTNYRIVGKE